MITHFNDRGFSLLEAVVAVGILALIITGIADIFLNSLRSNDIASEQLRAQSEGRRALLQFTSEARRMQTGNDGGYPLAAASSTEIIFYSNVDADNLVERVRYFLAANTLARAVIKPTGTPPGYLATNETILTLVHFVATSTPLFYYYDDTYAGNEPSLSQPVDALKVRLVGLEFVVERDRARPPGPITITSKVQLRNLKN